LDLLALFFATRWRKFAIKKTLHLTPIRFIFLNSNFKKFKIRTWIYWVLGPILKNEIQILNQWYGYLVNGSGIRTKTAPKPELTNNNWEKHIKLFIHLE
jgi:hypothetical protein